MKAGMTMTDVTAHEPTDAAARALARVEALRRRRETGVERAVPTAAARTVPGHRGRGHAAGRSRVGVAAFSVATMLGLVGVMGLVRPASPTEVAPTGTPRPTPGAGPTQGGAAPPVALTARPSVRVTTLAAAPVARTNGSH